MVGSHMKKSLKTSDETDTKKTDKMAEKSGTSGGPKKSSSGPTTEMIDGEVVEVDEDEGEEEGDYDDDDDDDDLDNTTNNNSNNTSDLSPQAIYKDRITRLNFRIDHPDGITRVLFVVPSEPLVWQV